MRRTAICLSVVVCCLLVAGWADAADRNWVGGTGNWDTISPNWDGAVWVDNDSAIFGGTAGTVTLTKNISITDMTITTGTYTIDGAFDLNFSGSILLDGVNANIETGITGSPALTHNAGSRTLTLGPPASLNMDLGAIQVNKTVGGNTTLNLQGDGNGSAASIKWHDGTASQIFVNKNGSGTWTLGDVTFNNRSGAGNGGEGKVTVLAGELFADTIRASHGVYLSGGVFHYNNPLLLNSIGARGGGRLNLSGGSFDNSSGAPIVVPPDDGQEPPNPVRVDMTWSGSGFTFIGSDDLDLGAGNVTLSGSPTVTVEAGALTVGGAIGDGTNIYGITKGGDGTLVLGGANTYNGDTTVSAGTLRLGTAWLDDGSVLSVAGGGAKLDLAHSDTDEVFLLNLGGSPAAAGTWGSTSSAADNQDDTYFSGTGIINNIGGVYTDGRFYWDGASVGGTGDAVSDGGSGDWDTSTQNWDKGFTAKEAWVNGTSKKAIFGGSSDATVTLGEDITVEEIEFAGTNKDVDYTVEGNTLNFTGTKTITGISGKTVTITSGITGKPTVNFDHSAGDSGKLTLAPAGSTTMDMATINMIKGSSAANTQLVLGGDTDNSADAITWSNVGQQLTLTKKGSGTWTVNGGYDNGPNGDARFYVDEGTLILNGTFNPSHAFEVRNGGTLSGTATIAKARSGGPVVQAGGTIAPGDGVGTLTVADDAFTMQDGSIYAWEMSDPAGAPGTGWDAISSPTVDLEAGWILDIIDAGLIGAMDGSEQFELFTEVTGAPTVNAVTIGAVPDEWDASGATVVFDDAGDRIYLTGLIGGTIPYTWEFAGAAEWASANWHDGTISAQFPAADADMTIDVGGSEVTVAADFISGDSGPAASVAVGETNTASLIVKDGVTLEVARTVAVGRSGTLQVDGTLTAASLESAGTLAVDGTLTADSTTVSGGALNVNAGATASLGKLAVSDGSVNLAEDVLAENVEITGGTVDTGDKAIVLSGTLTTPDAVVTSEAESFQAMGSGQPGEITVGMTEDGKRTTVTPSAGPGGTLNAPDLSFRSSPPDMGTPVLYFDAGDALVGDLTVVDDAWVTLSASAAAPVSFRNLGGLGAVQCDAVIPSVRGAVRPGQGIGTLDVLFGRLVFEAGSAFQPEVQGADASDLLNVDETLDVTPAALAISWLPGDAADSMFGGRYVVADSVEGIAGPFAVWGGGNIGAAYIAGVEHDVDWDEGDHGIRVTLHDQLAGDVDLDGEVARGDFLALRGAFGSTDADWLGGDLTFDGDVNYLDYIALKRSIGDSVPGGVGITPEPATLLLLALGACGLLGRRQTTKKRRA